MLRRRRNFREALAGLAITLIGAVGVVLVVDSVVMWTGALVLPLAVVGYTGVTWAGYRRSRAAFQTLADRAKTGRRA